MGTYILCPGQQGDKHRQLVAFPQLFGGPTEGAAPGRPPADPLYEREHHHPLQDVLPRPSEPVHLQGNSNSLELITAAENTQNNDIAAHQRKKEKSTDL